MTELICGSSGSGKGTYIIAKIKGKLGSGKKLYLIVPEQQAVIWETRICRELPPAASLDLEVLSFRRLANTVARQVGGLTYNYTGEGRKILLMWSALVSVRDSLKVYSDSGEREDKYISLMLETISEMKRNRISAGMLETAAEELCGTENKSLAERLSDVSLILSAYGSLCEKDSTEDPDNLLDTLEITLRTNEFFKNSAVFIDSFYSLTPIEMEILYHIIRTADDVYITFHFLPERTDIHFSHINRYYKTVKRLASAAGKETVTIELKECKRTKKESLLYLEKNLWNFSTPPIKTEDGGVKLITCADRYEEARAVGAEIEKLVQNGASYSDIAIVARDTSLLSGILDSRLEALNIPFHAAKRTEISNSPAIKFITSLLDTVGGGYKRENIVDCIKTGLCPVSAREGANFEEYTATWNLRGRKAYLDGELWSMNPSGYVKDISPWGKTVLLDACHVKEVIAYPLSKLDSVFQNGKAHIYRICESIYEILYDFGIYEKLLDLSDILLKKGNVREAQETKKLFSVILEILDTMVDTVGNISVDARRFSALFSRVAATYDIGSIPDGIDAVIFGSAFSVRAGEIKHVIIPGCIEGEFPMSVKDTGFFSDADKLALESVGINMGDNSAEQTGEELFRFWRTVTMASESVTVIVPASSSNTKTSPSIGAKQIKKLLSLRDIPFFEIAKKDLIWSKKSASDTLPYLTGTRQYDTVLSLGEKYPEILAKRSLSGSLSAENDRVSPEATEKIWGDRIGLTQTRIDSFSNCKFSYYMNYVLKLNNNERAAVNAVDVGNLVHRILELFFAETCGRTFPLEREETEAIADRILEKHISEILYGATLSSRQDYLISRLRRNVLVILDVLMNEFANSRFAPKFFELPMNGSDGDTPVPLSFESTDGTRVSLYGVIDRVDTYTEGDNVYVRVVDYKTGSKTFKRSDIAKGKNLQLLIYLFTLWKGIDCSFRRALCENEKTVVPAGMLYFSAPPDAGKSSVYLTDGSGETVAGESIKRTGLFLNDENILLAMDSTPEGKYTPCKDKKGKTDPKKVCTLEEFDTLFEETQNVIRKIADDMKGGACESIPSEKGQNSPCRYCKLKPVCRHIEGKEDTYDE